MKLNRSHIKLSCGLNQQPTKSQFIALGYDGLFIGWRIDIIGKEFTVEQIKGFTTRPSKPRGSAARHLLAKKKKAKLKSKRVKPKLKQPKKKILAPKIIDPYSSPQWIELRKKIYARDNYTCVNCGMRNVPFHAHHLLYDRSGAIWDVPHWYLVTLCPDCHKAEHSKRLAPPPKHY